MLWRRRATIASLLAIVIILATVTGCGPSASDTGTQDAVHATRTGQRYHRAGCRSLSQSDIPMTRAEAEQRGLTPCKVCEP